MDVIKLLEEYVSKSVLFIIAITILGSGWVYSVESRLANAAEKAGNGAVSYAVIVTKIEEFKKEVQRHNEEDIREKTKLSAQVEALVHEVGMMHEDMMNSPDHSVTYDRRKGR